ncbi:MFS transporter [Candidatus Lucifugimonas marina]|uniref:MFS transporter n=1 Tax=Candidatus Lucifugimonas marina TaxID=3038979 RepID=A0AAJ5ZF95_9CHLR|nr:MFS transporter [SAR202 cluster bacterium JH702]MDG0868439.1 MFS transporter [SAR202 cluster bacterium JH639]WFG35072.1 MFS transporter [SAR202 cluster bacterium JH545]WFG39029.1 MFS transporter [SAR202 cluster bacterium JH1073]
MNPPPSNYSDPRIVLAARTPFFYGWAVVLAAGSTMFVRNAAATLTIAVFVFPMSEDLGWSRTLIVGAAAAAGVVSMFVSPLAGWILQRYGARVLMASSVFLLGAVILSLRWTTNPISFYLLFGAGRLMFQAPLQIGGSTAVAQWFVRMRGRSSSILGVSHSLGMGLFPLFAQLFMNASDGDWRMAWFWMGISVWVIALPLTLFVFVNKPEDVGLTPDGDESSADKNGEDSIKTAAEQEEQWTLKEAMRTPAMWTLALVGGLVFFIHTGVNIHQAAFLRDHGISPSIAASALTVMAGGTAVGSILWGNLLDRLPVKIVYSATAAWLGGMALLFLLVDTPAMAFTAAALFGIGLGGLLVVPPVAVAHYFGRNSLGAIRGATEPFVSGGQAIGAIGAGLIFDYTGSYEATFPTFTAAAVIAIVLLALTRRPKKPNPAD